MNEKPTCIWTRPWSGPAKTLAWVAVLASVAFLVIWICSLVLEPNLSWVERMLAATLGAVFLAGVIAGLITFFRWVWCWRNFQRFLFGVACVATLIALVFAEENWRGHHAWQKHLREWEANGEPFTFDAVNPRAVPDDKNFALTPLLKPVYEYTQGTNGLVWNDTNGLARLQNTRADLTDGRQTNDHLVLGKLEQGTYTDLGACWEFYRGNTNYPQAPAGATPAQGIIFALAKLDPQIQELREAATTRPDARFPIHYEYEPTWAILLPHLAHVKGLTGLCEVRAIAQLAAGDSAKAFDELKLGLRLSDSLREEPLLIDHLVRIATLALDLQTIREGLARHAWSDAQLAELEVKLGGMDLLAEYKNAMRGERVLGTKGLDFVRRHGFRSEGMNYIANEDGASSTVMSSPLPSGWFYQNMLTISRLCQTYTLPAVDEKAHRVFPEIAEKGGQALAKLRWGPYTYFAKLLTPALGKAVLKSARMQVYLDATRVACALERYRLAKGKLPDTLEPLAPRFLAAIPADVIDGKPLRYSLLPDGGIVLYSVGWNQTDEGGKLVWKKEKTQTAVDANQGDWVWRLPVDLKSYAEP